MLWGDVVPLSMVRKRILSRIPRYYNCQYRPPLRKRGLYNLRAVDGDVYCEFSVVYFEVASSFVEPHCYIAYCR